ncbi:uncharacterized protein [Ptychodera flava]|uniref:uncharacterized protein isoform X2 n=1 Tax=Ptychodera flava TaxID=63121 RepID=UPI003969F6B9
MSFIGVGEDPEHPALPDVLRADSPAVCPIEIPSSMHNQMEMPHNRKLSYCEMEQGIRMTRMAEAGYPGNMPGYVHFINVEGGPNTPDSGYISENLSPVNAAFYPEQKVMTLQDPNVQQFSDDAPAFNDADMTSFNDACQSARAVHRQWFPRRHMTSTQGEDAHMDHNTKCQMLFLGAAVP